LSAIHEFLSGFKIWKVPKEMHLGRGKCDIHLRYFLMVKIAQPDYV